MVLVDLFENFEFVANVDTIFDFVKKFKANKEFKKITGMTLNRWDFSCHDMEIIEQILEKRKESYYIQFVDINDGWFNIWKKVN